MNRTAQRLFIVLGLAIAAFALAQDTFTLKRVAKEGEVLKYTLSADADFGGQKINISGIITDTITKVEADGGYSVESVQSDTKIKFGDQEMPMDQESKQVTKFSPTGLVLELKGEQTDPGSYRMANMNVLLTPPSNVKVGDKWSWEAKADGKTGSLASKTDYEVLGVEKVSGVDTVKISMTFTETEGSEKASMKATAWIEAANGALYKVEADVQDAPIAGAPGPVDMVLKLERKV